MTQLGGAVRVEPAKPIPSISGERERQHEEESRKVLNSALAIWAAGIVVVLTAILLKALISGNEPSPQVASDDPKTTPAAVGGEKSGSEAAPVASTDIEPKPPEGNSRESSSASEPPGTDATGGNVASGAKAAPSDSTDFKDKPPQSDSMESPSSPEPPGTESDRKPPADSPLSGTDRRKRPAGKAAADVQGDIPVQSPDEPAQPAAKDSQANTRVWIWRDASGKHAMDAEAVGFEEGRVQLEDKTGNRVFVPLEQLSRADQQFVREQFIQAEPKTPPTVAEPGTPRESPQDTVERGVRSTTREETAARAYFNMQRTLRSARNSEKRHRLTEFIATFPGTKAAQRAQEVLETIPLFDSDRSSSLRRR
jgi:hypothetical protein